MSQDSPQVQAIRARYKASLPDKAALFSSYLQRLLAQSPLTHSDYDDLHGELHKLAGSSGMYGYSDISELARGTMSLIADRQYDRLTEQLGQLRDLLLEHA